MNIIGVELNKPKGVELVVAGMKYAKASEVTLNIRCIQDKQKIEVDLKDNGVGFDMSSIPRGNGLKNVKARMDALNGHFTLMTGPGKGTFIHLNLDGVA